MGKQDAIPVAFDLAAAIGKLRGILGDEAARKTIGIIMEKSMPAAPAQPPVAHGMIALPRDAS